MEYIFGIVRRITSSFHNLKTISDSDDAILTGNTTIKREYDDCIIIDNFDVIKCYKTAESNGKYYRWYEIENHSRTINYTKETKENTINIESNRESLMESTDIIGELYDAVMEMSDIIAELTEGE